MKYTLNLLCIVAFTNLIKAQTSTVEVNLNVKHQTGDISQFERQKFITVHSTLGDRDWDSNAQRKQFLNDYDVYLGRDNGSLPWIYSQTGEDPAKPGWPSIAQMEIEGNRRKQNYANDATKHELEFRAQNIMIGGQPILYPTGNRLIDPITNNSQPYTPRLDDFEPLAEYYAQSLLLRYGSGGSTGEPKPAMVEVMNEPFVHDNDIPTTRAKISELHNAVANRIHELSPETLVGGFTAAHPMFEAGNFRLWENSWELFMDIAGENMDFFSVHLYDFLGDNDNGNPQYRSGSNVEAILDMISAYSFIKFGEVKPLNISEYGAFYPGVSGPYSRELDWANVRSFSSIQMQFLERQQEILVAMPFLLHKASWWNPPAGSPDQVYGPRLLRQKWEVAGQTGNEWEYADTVIWYDLWKNVNGTRADSKTSDQDIQVDAYVDGNKTYIILNSLEFEDRTINLLTNGINGNDVVEVMVRKVYFENNVTKLEEETFNTIQSQVMLPKQSTVILEYTFNDPIPQTEENLEQKYYASSYYKPIQANTTETFQINNVVKTGVYGEAVLRLGVGRDHGKSLAPTVTVNGSNVVVPEDWRGYDQNNRDRFFGVLEIPVPFSVIEESNTIAVSFGDSGGHISSVAMQVFNFSDDIRSVVPEHLPFDNFRIQSQGATCPGSSNGRVHIEALHPQNYNIAITAADYNEQRTFTQSFQFEDLKPGTYKVVITIDGAPDFKHEFDLVITEPTPIDVNSKVDKTSKQVELFMSGSSEYIIKINNETIRTDENNIVLALSNGANTIEVKTAKDCQGVFEKQILIPNGMSAHPNPVSDLLELSLRLKDHTKAELSIYNVFGVLVYHKTTEVMANKLHTNFSKLSPGIYFVDVKTETSTNTIKIVKK